MVLKVHGRPPQPHGVEHVDREKPGEDVAHEQCLQSRPSRVQGGEGTEDDRGGLECGGVHVETEDPVHGLQTSGITVDRVVGRGQSVGVLVPRGRAWEDHLDQNSCDVHVAERAGEGGQCAGRTPDEHASADNNRRHIVDKSVGEPRENIEDRVLVGRDNVAEVGAVEDVLEGWEDADPDGRAVFGRNISEVSC
jgi:hypothetical protein